MNLLPTSLLLVAAAGAPLAVASLLTVRAWRRAVLRATPAAAVPALWLALAGPAGAEVSLPWLVQHAVLELNAVGRVFLVVAGGTTQLADLPRVVVSRPALLLLLAGFGVKPGALTLHFWLPLAHPAAPVPASAVLSGAMIKAGLLGWIRFLPLGEATMPGCGYTWISAGLGAATLTGVWLLPGALEELPRKLSPEKLWDALWPLLLGGTLAALGAWLRRRFSGDVSRWLPAGDLGVLIEKLLARRQLHLPLTARSPHEHGPDLDSPSSGTVSRWPVHLERAGEAMARVEARLRFWPVAGALWLLLIVILLGLLAASPH